MGYELFYIILGLVTVYIYFRKKALKGKVIAGPKGLPVLGCIHKINGGNIRYKFMDYAEQYGEIFQVKMLFDSFVVLNSESIIRKSFGGEKYKHFFNDRASYFFGKHFPFFDNRALTFLEDGSGHFHKTAKRFVVQALHAYGSGLQDLENNVMSEMVNLLQRIENKPGQKFECVRIFLQSLTNIISLMLIGETVLDDETEITMFLEKMKVEDFFVNPYVNFIMSSFPFLRYLPGKYRNEYRKGKSIFAKLIERFFYDKKKTHISGQVRGIVDLYLEEQKRQMESNGDVFFTDETIIAEVLDIFGAGVTTTLALLTNTMLILLNYPQYQVKLQEEFDRKIGQGIKPTYKDRANCNFFKAFEMEVHRYINVAPLLLPHKCKEHLEFEGYDVEANSTIIGNAWFLHHNKEIWGDPWSFRPERFLDERGDLLPSEHTLRKNLMSFGYGPRQCPGETFAKTRYFLIISSLLQRWNFAFPAGKHVPCDPRLHENFAISNLIRAKQFDCCAKRRI
ncbi:cytochrome P450 2D28-like [Mercenaria mercenaria]|uniref:cytochrome P450 2D28-like n=1 Tax=Mercenaria mercenaria TaxID=6596 RepID=UPI00234ED180|nr:cytochrome P450 2D28-like [Mercenaria mercenaria]